MIGKHIIPLFLEELANLFLWGFMIKKVPERFAGGTGTAFLIGIEAAILAAYLFDALARMYMAKRYEDDGDSCTVPLMLRFFVHTFIFWIAFRYISLYAPASMKLLIIISCQYAIIYIFFTDLLEDLFGIEPGILSYISEMMRAGSLDDEDDDDDLF